MGLLEVGAIASVIGNGVYGYAMASGMPVGEYHVVGILNYLATPVGLFGNGVCNVSDEYGIGPVDRANNPRRNGMTISKDKDGQIHYHSINRKPKENMSNLEVGVAQSFPFLMLNTLALGIGSGAGFLVKTFSGN